MPKLEVEQGIELYYEELGSGDKYVLSLMMDFPPISTTRELAKNGYHVFLISNRGIGKSTHIFEDYGIEWFDIFAKDVVTFADKMGIDKFIYMGCSHGAGTGWHICLRYPERVSAFISMSGGPHNISEAQWSYRQMREQGIVTKPMEPDHSADEALSKRQAINDAYAKQNFLEQSSPEEKALNYRRPLLYLETEEKLQEALRTIQTPTLMLCCVEDPICRPDLTLRTAECLPNGKTVLYSGFGHGGPYSFIVEECLEETLNFLRNVEETGKPYKKVIQE